LEILYADDLVLMADSMEELQLKFDRWKSVIDRKGLKVNMGKTKEMVSGEGGERVVSRIDPCGVCEGESKFGTFKRKRCVSGMMNREAETGLNDGIERVD
jgi:hypothetical protein